MIVIFWRAIAWRPCVKLGHVLSAVDRDCLLTRIAWGSLEYTISSVIKLAIISKYDLL